MSGISLALDSSDRARVSYYDIYAADLRYAPVSYTHLRAHETVLDLVCRLLLEKKKPYETIAVS